MLICPPSSSCPICYPRRALDARFALALRLVVAIVGALICWHLVGCAPPSRLWRAASAYDTEAGALNASTAELERAFKTDVSLAVSHCYQADPTCVRQVQAPLIARYAARRKALGHLDTLGRQMRTAVDTAEKCRAAGDSFCEVLNLDSAERLFAELHYDRVILEEHGAP